MRRSTNHARRFDWRGRVARPARPRRKRAPSERGCMSRDAGGLPRQIGAKGLKAGDILFKHASKGLVSQKIKAGQASHYHRALAQLRDVPGGKPASQAIDEGRDIAGFPDKRGSLSDAPPVEEATDITHVAVALGSDDV